MLRRAPTRTHSIYLAAKRVLYLIGNAGFCNCSLSIRRHVLMVLSRLSDKNSCYHMVGGGASLRSSRAGQVASVRTVGGGIAPNPTTTNITTITNSFHVWVHNNGREWLSTSEPFLRGTEANGLIQRSRNRCLRCHIVQCTASNALPRMPCARSD